MLRIENVEILAENICGPDIRCSNDIICNL